MFNHGRGQITQKQNERDSSTPSNPPRGRGHGSGRGRGCGGKGVTHDVLNWVEPIKQLKRVSLTKQKPSVWMLTNNFDYFKFLMVLF